MDNIGAIALNSEINSQKILSIEEPMIGMKINGSFNKTEYKLNEQKTLISSNKKYIGIINNKETEYIINPEKDNLHKGKIQGRIGNDKVNLIVFSDIFGKKTIFGLYKDEQIELTISRDFFFVHIEGKNTTVNIRKKFFTLNKSIEGKFEYNNELMPLILSYIKHYDDIRKEAA